MKLLCAVVGEDAKSFSVDIESEKCVDDLRHGINEKLPGRIQCVVDVKLYLAKRGESWLKAVDVDGLVDTDLPGFLQMRPLLPIQYEGFSFPDEVARVDGDIHVLVVIPKLSGGPHPHRKERWVKLNETTAQNARGHSRLDPFSRWSEIFPIFFEDLSKYIETVQTIPDSLFDLLSTMLTWIMKCFNCNLIGDDNEENRLHLIAPVLWSIVQGLPESTIHMEEHMDGIRVAARVHFDFIIVCGTKRVGVIAAKEEMFRHGMAKALLGCEVIADLDSTHEVCAVVTNMEKWIFMKSLDKEISYDEFNPLTFNSDGVPHKDKLLNIVGKLYSMLSLGLPSVDEQEEFGGQPQAPKA